MGFPSEMIATKWRAVVSRSDILKLSLRGQGTGGLLSILTDSAA